MIGRLLRVARPDDWTGMVARVAVGMAFVLLAIVIPLASLPAAWVALASGRPLLVRLALLLVAIVVLALAQRVLDARLPRSVVLLGRSVRFHDGMGRQVVPIDQIAALHVEQRPPPQREVFVLEQLDGAEHDLCPTRWAGAPELHRVLGRRVAAADRRRRRVASRAKRKAEREAQRKS